MTVCILYGYMTYYGMINETFSIPSPIATKTCIQCEKTKEANITRIKKEKNIKDIMLTCKEVEI